MKIFQILDGFCHWDATSIHPTLESTQGRYTSDIHFVEAPDYVFEGWGYDENRSGDERFLKPQPPEGWVYDEHTGTFHPEGWEPPPPPADPMADLQELVVDLYYRTVLLELGV